MRKTFLFAIIFSLLIQFNTSVFAEEFMELLSNATRAQLNGDYSTAIKYYNEIIKQYPKEKYIYSSIGTIYLQQYEDYQKAIEFFTIAINDGTMHSNTYVYRGVARMKLGDIDRATSDLTQAISINNKLKTPDSFAYCTRALLYSMNQKYELAIQDSTQAIKLQPKYPEAFLYRGMAKMQIAGKQKSIEGIKSAITDINYSKEQSLQMGNTKVYQDAMGAYKMATNILAILRKNN